MGLNFQSGNPTLAPDSVPTLARFLSERHPSWNCRVVRRTTVIRGPASISKSKHRLRDNPHHSRIPVLVVYSFDFRTRLGPFLFADMRLLTAGPRAVAGALYNAGFTRNRIVLNQWNPNFRPSKARFDGDLPQMLFVSSMQIHSAAPMKPSRTPIASVKIGHSSWPAAPRPSTSRGTSSASAPRASTPPTWRSPAKSSSCWS